jgi:hypothetical protein
LLGGLLLFKIAKFLIKTIVVILVILLSLYIIKPEFYDNVSFKSINNQKNIVLNKVSKFLQP